jgi:hypothetical protein
MKLPYFSVNEGLLHRPTATGLYVVIRFAVIAKLVSESFEVRRKHVDCDAVNFVAFIDDLKVSEFVVFPRSMQRKKLEDLEMPRPTSLDCPNVNSPEMTSSTYDSSDSWSIKDFRDDSTRITLTVRRKLRSFVSYDTNEHKNRPLCSPSDR